MAIVAKYEDRAGTVLIDDDCYRDVPEAEMQRRIAQAQKVAWEILMRREQEHEKSDAGRSGGADGTDAGGGRNVDGGHMPVADLHDDMAGLRERADAVPARTVRDA